MRASFSTKKSCAVFSTALVLGLSLSGFAPAPRQELDVKKIYRRDIALEVNGQKAEGVFVAPRAGTYLIRGKAKGNFDLLTITTCHRDFKAEALGHSFEYVYQPVPGIEDTRACPLEITGVDRKGEHAWALVEFEDQDTKLPALLKCNGESRPYRGVSICQSREGLFQEIVFNQPVKVSPSLLCPMPVTDGKTFRFKIAPRGCTYAFQSEDGVTHRLMTIGYQGILLRED